MMLTLFLMTAAVLLGAAAFFIHVGKSVAEGSYAPFRERVESFREKDTLQDFSIIGVLLELDFDSLKGSLPEDTVRTLKSDPALLFMGLIHFNYLDRYIDDKGYWRFLHAAVERWRHAFYKMFMETFYIDIDDARILLHEAIRDTALLCRGNDLADDAVRVLRAAVFKGKEISPGEWAAVKECVRHWEKTCLPEAYTAIDELKKCRKHMDAGKEKNIVASWLNTIYAFNRPELPSMGTGLWNGARERL